MAKPIKSKDESAEVNITPLMQGTCKLRIIGTTPLFQNRMAEKVKWELLVGGKKKGRADRAAIKHNPIVEYRNSAEILPDGPTALGLKVTAVKGAMRTASIDTPGASKAETGRLLFFPGDFVPLYGTPQLRMDVTRSKDINRTPDIRTRAFLPKWGAELEIKFVTPQLSVHSVVSLLCNSGVLAGVGDWRQEKGSGSFGAFRVIGEGDDDPEWRDLIANHGRKVQLAALENPEYANRDTKDLMAFYEGEVQRRRAA